MSRYKLLGDYKNHYMVQHPDGSSFPVAKKGISKTLQDKIKSFGGQPEPLKLYAGTTTGPLQASDAVPDSTPVDINLTNPSVQDKPMDPSIVTGTATTQDQPSPGSAPFGMGATYFGPDVPMSADISSPMAQLASNGPLPTPANLSPEVSNQSPPQSTQPSLPQSKTDTTPKAPDPSAPPSDPYSAVPGYKEQAGAVAGMGKANSDYQKNAAQIFDQQAKDLANVHEQYQTQLKGVDDKIQDISNDVMNGSVDPNRVWNNMGTGNKIGAAIAIALGGLASGATGKSNAAVDVLNKTIDNDIDSQKLDMNKKNTLLGHYMQQYNNLEQAETATKMHLTAIAGAQVQKLAAMNGSQQAMLQAQMLNGQLKAQAAPTLQHMAAMQALSSAGPLDPAVAAQAVSLIVPKDQQAKAYDEINRVGSAVKAKDAINNFFGSANDQNSVMGRVMNHGGFEPADMKALEANVMPVIKDLEGRVNEREMDVLKGLYPAMGDSTKTIQTKLAGLNNFLNTKSQSALLDGNRIKIKGGVYNSQGQNRFNEQAAQ